MATTPVAMINLMIVALVVVCVCNLDEVVWRVSAQADVREPLFPAAFVFGDSLVDVGNNNYVPLALAKANLPPNGIDFPTGRPTGRFCNGKTTTDVLCDYIGLPYPPPAKAPSSTGTAILRGLNYASGAGGILDGTGANYIDRISFNEQLQLFQQTITEMNFLIGPSATSDLLKRSIFAFIFGSNDYINNYLLSDSDTRTQYSPTQFQDLLISTYRTQLTTLYNWGVRKFLVSAVGPLGCIPSRLAIGSPDGKCVAFDNSLVVGFNTAVKALTIDLTNSLPGSIFLFVNPYDAFIGLINNPRQAGFTVVNQGCCGGGKYHGQIPCLPALEQLCTNRNTYIFWDPFHPTQAVNEILARSTFIGGPEDVYPINVLQLSRLQL